MQQLPLSVTPLPSRFPGPTPSAALAISASAMRSSALQLIDTSRWPAPLYYGSRSLRALRRAWPVVWRLIVLAGAIYSLMRLLRRRRQRARQKTVERSYALFGSHVRFGLDMGGTLSKVVYFEPAKTDSPAQAALRARVSAFIKRSNSYGVTGRRDPELELRCAAISGTLHFVQFQTAMMPNFVNIVREHELIPADKDLERADESTIAAAISAAAAAAAAATATAAKAQQPVPMHPSAYLTAGDPASPTAPADSTSRVELSEPGRSSMDTPAFTPLSASGAPGSRPGNSFHQLPHGAQPYVRQQQQRQAHEQQHHLHHHRHQSRSHPPHHVHSTATSMLPLHPSRLGRSYSAAWRSEDEFRRAQQEAAQQQQAEAEEDSSSSSNGPLPVDPLAARVPSVQQLEQGKADLRPTTTNDTLAAPAEPPSASRATTATSSISCAESPAHTDACWSEPAACADPSPSPNAVSAAAALADMADEHQPTPSLPGGAPASVSGSLSEDGTTTVIVIPKPPRSRSSTGSSVHTPSSVSCPSSPHGKHSYSDPRHHSSSIFAAVEEFGKGFLLDSNGTGTTTVPAATGTRIGSSVSVGSASEAAAALAASRTAAALSTAASTVAGKLRGVVSRRRSSDHLTSASSSSSSSSVFGPQQSPSSSTSSSPPLPPSVCATGGGAYKFESLFLDALHIRLHKEDEMSALVKGIDFCIHTCAEECYTLRSFRFRERLRTESYPSAHIQYPYLVCNIGSGVSILKVTGPSSYERVGGSSLGGGTFYGLTRALTGCTSFEQALALAERGRSCSADLLVGDIYGGGYPELGLPASTVAASFGKLVRGDALNAASKEDLAKSALVMITNNIGALANLYARKVAQTPQIIFVGNFLHGNDIARRGLAFATDYWSKSQNKALFLAHEGYFGAVGSLLGGT